MRWRGGEVKRRESGGLKQLYLITNVLICFKLQPLYSEKRNARRRLRTCSSAALKHQNGSTELLSFILRCY